jgi:uncharacterized membrane protein
MFLSSFIFLYMLIYALNIYLYYLKKERKKKQFKFKIIIIIIIIFCRPFIIYICKYLYDSHIKKAKTEQHTHFKSNTNTSNCRAGAG